VTGPTDDPLVRARTLLDLRRPEQAVELVQRHLAQHPSDAEALCLLATAHHDLGQDVLALDAANRARAAAPDWEYPHRLASSALLRAGRAADAADAARHARALQPDLWATHAQLAYALGACLRWDEAYDAAVAAVSLAPQEAEAHACGGYAAMGREWWDVAERALLRALELDPQHAGAHNNLAVVRLKRRQVGEAARGFSASAAADPTDSEEALGNLLGVLWRAVFPVHAGLLAGVTVLVIGGRQATGGGLFAVLTALPVVVAIAFAASRIGRLPPEASSLLRARLARPLGKAGVAATGALAAVLVTAPVLGAAAAARDAAILLLFVSFLFVLGALS
jgi:Flp pilus assembly protein TadD